MRLLLILLLGSPVFARPAPKQVPRPVPEPAPTELVAEPLDAPLEAGAAMRADPVIPESEGSFEKSEGESTGSGSVTRSLARRQALPMTDSSQPGGATQARGPGLSAEDVDVEVLGISFNPPQGGGADLSIFPSYFWSDYRLRWGPARGSLNPQSVTGALELVPWTASALEHGEGVWGARAVNLVSTLGMDQVAAGAYVRGRFAGLVGATLGAAQGPTGGASGQLELGRHRVRAHFFGTRMDVPSPGSASFPSPQARSLTQRLMPVLSGEWRLTPELTWRTTAFYDDLYLEYRDPAVSVAPLTSDNARQWGLAQTLESGGYRLGLSARQFSYTRMTGALPLQTQGNLQLSKSWDWSPWTFEAQGTVVWISEFDPQPQASVGLARKLGESQQLFARASWTQKFPSLLDRYYAFGTFVGNPGLRTEQDGTLVLGWRVSTPQFEAKLQGLGQWRENARVRVGNTVSNLGRAWVGSGQLDAEWAYCGARLGEGTALLGRASVLGSWSQLSETGTLFAYLPVALGTLGTTARWTRQGVGPGGGWLKTLEGTVRLRAQAAALADVGNEFWLPPFMVVDAELRLALLKQVYLSGVIENLFDSPLQTVLDFPIHRSGALTLRLEI